MLDRHKKSYIFLYLVSTQDIPLTWNKINNKNNENENFINKVIRKF